MQVRPDRRSERMQRCFRHRNLWRPALCKLQKQGYMLSSMWVIFILLIPFLPFLIILWLILALTYKKAKDTEKRIQHLVVLGIIIIVASLLSLYGYRVAQLDQIRPKVARAKSEIRNLAVNLETYYIDHDSYPPAVDLEGKIIPLPSDGSGVSAGYLPWLLTTPVPYTSSLPTEPFHKLPGRGDAPYRYATNGLACWIMTSNGPDEKPDIRIDEYPIPEKGGCEWKEFVQQYGTGDAIEYDASNGLMSVGDVVRVGP